MLIGPTATVTATSEGASGASLALTITAPPNAITSLTVRGSITFRRTGHGQTLTTAMQLAPGATASDAIPPRAP